MDEVKIPELFGAESDPEMQVFAELAAELAFSAPLASPPLSVKRRLFAAIATAPVEVSKGVFVLRQEEVSWRPTPSTGVYFKHLYLDPQTQLQTLILKLEPGARYPRHRHAAVEQCLVLSGDVTSVGGPALRQGDFEWSAADTEHDSITTVNGCELLIIASVHNEMLP